MTFSKPVRILIGIATIWYALYLLFTLAGILILFGFVVVSVLQGGESVLNLRVLFTRIPGFELFLAFHICGLFLEVGLLVFYLIHTIRNTKANDALKIALGLGHLFLPFVAMPIYYYLYIWRANPPEWAAAQGRNLDLRPENLSG
jgi:hypothetical protein